MASLTLYNGKLLLSDNGGTLKLSDSASNPCCCGTTCSQPTTSGLNDPRNNGWQPKTNNAITFKTTLPITYQFKIERAGNCGGQNFSRQAGNLACYFVLSTPRNVRLSVSGIVEEQDSGFDFGTLSVSGMNAEISSYGRGRGCSYAANSIERVISLPAGTHNYTMSVDTRDPLYHDNSTYTFTIEYA